MSLTKKSEDELYILDSEKLNFTINDSDKLTLSIDGNQYQDIEINPAFPLSEVGRYLSILDKDGNEIGMLKDIRDLNEKTQNLLESLLERIYFMPKITKINSIEEEYGVSRWDVMTEKGARSFDIRSRRRDVRPFGRYRIIIHDVDGNRYEIPDRRKLDKASQKILSSEI